MKFTHQVLRDNPLFSQYSQRLSQGLAPPLNRTLVAWLAQHQHKIHKLLPQDLSFEKLLYFDLSYPDDRSPDQVAAFSQSINQQLALANTQVGVGQYNENRHCYQSDVFQSEDEQRTLHIGMDLFVPPQTELFAPLDATVHSFQNNHHFLDYGPTIILHHNIGEDLSFYTLYGHLTLCSLDGLRQGDEISQGEMFARVGNYPENGNWPPHVHVQIITDMLGMEGDFPGVVAPNEGPLWLTLCPDPHHLLKLPPATKTNTVSIAP